MHEGKQCGYTYIDNLIKSNNFELVQSEFDKIQLVIKNYIEKELLVCISKQSEKKIEKIVNNDIEVSKYILSEAKKVGIILSTENVMI